MTALERFWEFEPQLKKIVPRSPKAQICYSVILKRSVVLENPLRRISSRQEPKLLLKRTKSAHFKNTRSTRINSINLSALFEGSTEPMHKVRQSAAEVKTQKETFVALVENWIQVCFSEIIKG